MAMKIRLARGGSKKRPFYRIVAADSRMPRDGRYVEKLGTYNPLVSQAKKRKIALKKKQLKQQLLQKPPLHQLKKQLQSKLNWQGGLRTFRGPPHQTKGQTCQTIESLLAQSPALLASMETCG